MPQASSTPEPEPVSVPHTDHPGAYDDAAADTPVPSTAPRRYGVIGTGAVGGLYGGRLAAAGHDVRFLVRSDHAHVARHGLRLDSPWGDVRLGPDVATDDPADLADTDVILLATKTTADHALDSLLAAAGAHGGTVVVLQNGLGNEARVAAAAPGATVLGGLCFVCANRVGPGHIVHLDYGRVGIGEHGADGVAAGATETVRAVAADFTAAKIPVTIAHDLVRERWKKLVWNIAYNGPSVLYAASTAELMADPARRADVEALMWEVLAAAAADGHDLGDDWVAKMLADTEAMRPYATSMKLDADAGRPLELEAIYAAPVAVADAHGVDVPIMRDVLERLRATPGAQVQANADRSAQ